MTKTIQILLFSILILTCNSANSQKKKNEIILKNGFTVVQDTISIDINGEMTHALKFKEKYYVLYKQQILKFGGYGKRYLCVLNNGKVERVVDCPMELQTVYLDFYVKNAKIGPNDYKVKVNVADTTFTVDHWQPYFIKNAPMGNLKLKIQLLDAAGEEVSGPNTSVERSVTLKN